MCVCVCVCVLVPVDVCETLHDCVCMFNNNYANVMR